MKIILSIFFAAAIWIALFKVFFFDVEDFWENAKENTFWFAVDLIFDANYGGVRFLIFIVTGLLGGTLLYQLL